MMKLKIINQDEFLLQVEVGGESVGFVNLIKEELWKDKYVDEAAYIKEHPYMSEPKVYVKTKKKKPKGALADATKRISVKLKGLKGEFKKALKG